MDHADLVWRLWWKTTPNKSSVSLKDADLFREWIRRKGKGNDGWRTGEVILWGKNLRTCLYFEYSNIPSCPRWLSFVFPASALSLRASFLPVCIVLFFPACSFPSACHSARRQPSKCQFSLLGLREKRYTYSPLLSSTWIYVSVLVCSPWPVVFVLYFVARVLGQLP